ncbi:dermonecrotic toxin domain-containing protein [Pandoraea anhela]|uniref:Dermonecrotic toxin N-terminal domain-containing protein n=1 Tax=Pandoraea anhela TaxID=2508295 RepID=A0A5E4V355_9BURK|nr:DUF6543 domain-containing protein [Pandoraea anhela]VVE06044.1 hypothetical protein PAN31108_02377 [Pandoraea anhela]
MHANAAGALAISIPRARFGDASVDAQPSIVIANVARFDALSTAACTMFDEPPEAQTALGLLLRLAEYNVCVEDLAALNDDLIGRFADAFGDDPWRATYLVDRLPVALAAREPGTRVEAVCETLLDAAAGHDFEPAVACPAAPAPATSRFGGAWRRYFCDWRTSIVEAWRDFLLLGSGARASHRHLRRASPPEAAYAAPALDFTRNGKTGYVLGLLFMSSLCHERRPGLPDRRHPVFAAPGMALVDEACFNIPDNIATMPTPDRTMLDRIGRMLAESTRVVRRLSRPAAGALHATLDRVLSFPSCPFPAAEAYLPSRPALLVTNGTANVSPFPSMAASPEMQRLMSVAQLWQHRAATHTELRAGFSPMLTFTPLPDEQTLLDGLLGAADELRSVTLSELRLRRYMPAEDDKRAKRVTYWPLLEAADNIRSGKLNLTATPAGVDFDICVETPAGAIYETPTIMSSGRFDAIVSRWIVACRERASRTWELSADLAKRANGSLIAAVSTSLASIDLSLAGSSGVLPSQALRLGQATLANISLSDDPSANVFFSHRLEFSVRLDNGTTQLATPAGTCIVSAPAMNDTTLLYVQGDAQTWRAYPSPQALLDDIGSNETSLHSLLCDRLPLSLRRCARTQLPVIRLRHQQVRRPLALATQATLATIAADGPLRLIHPGTRPRLAQYLAWLSGADSGDVAQRLRQRRAQEPHDAPRSPDRSPDVSLSDVAAIAHIADLRHRVSLSIPRVRLMTRQHLTTQLKRCAALRTDPEKVYVKTSWLEAQSLTDVALSPTLRLDKLANLPLLVQGSSGLREMPGSPPLTKRSPLFKDVFDATSAQTLRTKLDKASKTFWDTSRDHVRNVIKSEFITQVWLHRTYGRMSDALVAIASHVAGPIELGRLSSDALEQTIETPAVEREWLRIAGRTTTLMSASVAGQSPCLLIAPYTEGLRVYGFDDRAQLTTWFERQMRNETTRARVAATLAEFTSPTAAWLEKARLDETGERETAARDTFTAVASAYETRQQMHWKHDSDGHSVMRPVLAIMDALAKFDLALGAGTWLQPAARPISIAYSAADLGIGMISLVGGLMADDTDLSKQGWHSVLSAIGAQGMRAAHFRALMILTGDMRYKYFVADAPHEEEVLINGLHRVAGRFYAAIDADTRAYVSFDDATGFFRMVHADPAAPISDTAPLLTLTPGGEWHVPVQSDFPVPALDEPQIAWRIDQGFRARHDRLRDGRHVVFERARRAVTSAGASGTTTQLRWQLRLRKLEFLDLTEHDLETLGTLAGRIDFLQNAVDASELFVISPLANDAARLGAVYREVIQRPRVYIGYVHAGLMRACALVSPELRIEAMVDMFNQLARWPPSVTAEFVNDLSEFGQTAIRYIDEPSLSLGLPSLDTLFDGEPRGARAFEITAGTRKLLLGRRLRGTGAQEYYFMDPAVAIVVHANYAKVLSMMRAHLGALARPYELVSEGTVLAVETNEIDLPRLAEVKLYRSQTERIPARIALHI